MEKFGLRLTGRRKCYFSIFVFPFFQIPNDYCQKSYDGFRGLLVISTTSQIFLIYTFENVTVTLSNFFKTPADMHFVFLFFFLNETKLQPPS